MNTTTEWLTSNAGYGLGYYHAGLMANKAETVSAGLTRAERAYSENAHCFPRFERQKIRALVDENILSGAKQPDPAMLQRIPMVPRVDTEDRPPSASSRAGSQRSGRSMRSNQSYRSNRSEAHSQRSNRSQRAGSEISRAGAPSAAFLKTETAGRPPYFGVDHYNTYNSLYGNHKGAKAPEVGRGREIWMLGRGGGQITTFNNSLHRESGMYVPEIRAESLV